jgi:predicted  nucleic acid-binding Zn-ribbon protein
VGNGKGAEKKGLVRVEKSMERLLVLQECDLEIARLKREMADIPKRRAQMESALDAQKGKVAGAEKGLREAQERIKRAEGEIEAARQQERKYREQQLQIKSNEEYRALEKQIAALREQVSGYEDAELADMEAVDRRKAEAAEQRAELDRQSQRVEAEVAEFLKQAEGLGGQLAALEAERPAKAAEVDAEWLARYERIAAKGGGAIAVVEHGACGHCHMKLSPAQVVEARKRDRLSSCAFCGRILYAPA